MATTPITAFPIPWTPVALLPDLGVVSNACSFVGEHSGAGRFAATAVKNYIVSPAMQPVVEATTLSNAMTALGISLAMQPVVGAPTTAAALTALGINSTLQTVITAADLAAAMAALGISPAMQPVVGAATLASARAQLLGGNPNLNRATSIGNAIPQYTVVDVYATTVNAATWENAGSFQLVNNAGHATATNKVGLYAAIEATGAASGDSWAVNALTKVDSGAVPNAAHEVAELDLNNSSGTHYGDTANTLGLPAIWNLQLTGLSQQRCTAAMMILGNLPASAPMWNRGIALSNNSVRLASFMDYTSSNISLDIRGSHIAALDTTNGTFSSGPVRFSTGQKLISRNVADSADVALIQLGTGNAVAIGDVGATGVFVGTAGGLMPQTDNTITCGEAGHRWTAVYAVSGTILTSDPRLKTDMAALPSSLGLLDKINPITFRWKDGGSHYEEQEVEEAVHDTEEVEGETQPAFDDVPVFDADGKPAMNTVTVQGVAHEMQLSRRVPRMTRRTVKRQVAVPHEGRRTHWGFDATNVKAAFDDLGMDFGGYVYAADDTHSLRPDQLIPVLWKACQEMARKLGDMEIKLAALEAAKPA